MGIFDKLGQAANEELATRSFGWKWTDRIKSGRVDQERSILGSSPFGQTYALQKRDEARGEIGSDTIFSEALDRNLNLAPTYREPVGTVRGALTRFLTGDLLK